MKNNTILITLILAIVSLFGVVGCGVGSQSGLQNKTEESQNEPEGENIGAFFSLQEAYDKGWLTQNDLMSIAYYHSGGRLYNEEIMPEDYSPQPKMPEILSDETQLKIKSTAAKEYREEYKITEAEAVGFTINQYCGTYGNCVVVMMRDVYSGTTGEVWTDTVSDINFYYNSGKSIQVWRETE